MKRNPEAQHMEDVLRSSHMVKGGLMGADPRPFEEVIEVDARELDSLGVTALELAARMQKCTEMAREGMGRPVTVDERFEVSVRSSRGSIACPWPHAGSSFKTMTAARRTDRGDILRWSDLSVHLIGAHAFFQGRGSPPRLEPSAPAGSSSITNRTAPADSG